MLSQLLAVIFAGAQAQASPAPPPSALPSPAVLASPLATEEELKRLRAELPKVSKSAKLLNGTEVAGSMDYPKEAVDKGEQGTVKLWLLVGPDGRPQRCLVDASSGSQTLDAQTCDLYMINAKFRPARDSRGRPVTSLERQVMSWRLQDAPSVAPAIVRNSLVVGPAGEVRSCKAELLVRKAWVNGPEVLCSRFLKEPNALVLLARERSKLHDALVVVEQIGLTDAADPMPEIGRGPGEVLIFLRSATLRHAPDGRRISCTPGESVGVTGFVPDLCGVTADSVSYSGGNAKAPTVRLKTALYLKGEPN